MPECANNFKINIVIFKHVATSSKIDLLQKIYINCTYEVLHDHQCTYVLLHANFINALTAEQNYYAPKNVTTLQCSL